MAKEFHITLLPGDGIGPEIIDATRLVIERVSQLSRIKFVLNTQLMGGAAVDQTSNPLPEETLIACRASDSVLLGAVGGPQWDHLPPSQRPEKGLLRIRQALGVFANLRPAILFPQLRDASSLKAELLGDQLDLLVVRELTGDVYFGDKKRICVSENEFRASDEMTYSTTEIDRVARVAFRLAGLRRGKVTSVDKANVLETSRLWREVVSRVHQDYPKIALEHMYVDNAAMQLVRNPCQFDVILTGNLFGDILSDEASMLTGSIGMLPSASLREDRFGLYEPIHGSAPDIAGQNKANPLATILSFAMMLEYSFDMVEWSNKIKAAIFSVLDCGLHTIDLQMKGLAVGTRQMAEEVVKRI